MIQENIVQNQLKEFIDQLQCPLTHDIFQDPVSIQTGHTFDRVLISRWFARGNFTNPLTGLPLTTTQLYPNLCLKNIINKLPHVKLRAKRQKQDTQLLLKALQKLWNNSTPDGMEQIKKQNQELKHLVQQQSQEKLIQRMQYQAKVQVLIQKLQSMQKSYKYLSSLMKRSNDMKKIMQQNIQRLTTKNKQYEKLLSQYAHQKFNRLTILNLDKPKSSQKYRIDQSQNQQDTIRVQKNKNQSSPAKYLIKTIERNMNSGHKQKQLDQQQHSIQQKSIFNKKINKSIILPSVSQNLNTQSRIHSNFNRSSITGDNSQKKRSPSRDYSNQRVKKISQNLIKNIKQYRLKNPQRVHNKSNRKQNNKKPQSVRKKGQEIRSTKSTQFKR